MSPKATIPIIIAVFALSAAPSRSEDTPLCWSTECADGSQTMSHLLTAVSGKPNSEKTDKLLLGVTSIVREDNQYRLVRCDGAQLMVPRNTEVGERMFSCMEKVERQARKKIGEEAADYVRRLDTLSVTGDTVELHHAGDENVNVPLPTNQPWLPVKLKELRLKNIRLHLVESEGQNTPHKIKSIDGIAAIVDSAGINVSVEPREFWRYKDKQGHTHLVFGIKSLIPAPIRFVLHLPDVMHFNLKVNKKKDKENANNSESAAPKSAPDGQHDS